jgi:neurofibromin 1
VDISSKCIEAVIGALLYPLEEFAEQYSNLYNHPPHILRSEVYLLHVLADCFLANWDWTQQAYGDRGVEGRASAGSPTLGSMNGHSAKGLVQDGRPAKVRDSRVLPRPLDSVLIGRVLQVMKTFLPPFSDEYALAARKLFPLQAYQYGPQRRQYDGDGTSSFRTLPGDTDDILEDGWIRDVLESDTRTIIEFISASNWQVVFDHLQTSLRLLQIVFPLHGDAASGVPVTEDDKNALATLRLVEYLWVDMSRLQAVISEVCNSFFHLRKTFKITLALALPPLIMTWAERHSEDFVRLHLSHGRADAGVDRLFDITHSLVENGNWRTTLQPLQVSLLLLVPDVFETAASMPSAGGKYLEKGDIPKAGSSIFKKVAFLEALRKAVRNGNPTAAYCLVVLLKHARHFDSEDRESGLFNYALDIYDDVRDAIFQKYAPGGELVPFEEDLLVAAFVSFIHLDADASIDRILSQCFASTSPLVYKSAFVRACCHIAQEEPSSTYSSLLHEVTRYVKSHLTVWPCPMMPGRIC